MNVQSLRTTLQTLALTPAARLPQPRTQIIDTLPKDAPERLQGFKHGAVFTARAMLQAMDLAAKDARKAEESLTA